MKNWYIELYVKDNKGRVYSPAGTEYCMIYRDLKTLRGVLNRVKKWNMDNIVGIKIFNFYDNLYTDLSDMLVFKSGETE